MPLLIFAGTFALIISFLLGFTPLWWVILPAALAVAFILMAILWGVIVVLVVGLLAVVFGDKI